MCQSIKLTWSKKGRGWKQRAKTLGKEGLPPARSAEGRHGLAADGKLRISSKYSLNGTELVLIRREDKGCSVLTTVKLSHSRVYNWVSAKKYG